MKILGAALPLMAVLAACGSSSNALLTTDNAYVELGEGGIYCRIEYVEPASNGEPGRVDCPRREGDTAIDDGFTLRIFTTADEFDTAWTEQCASGLAGLLDDYSAHGVNWYAYDGSMSSLSLRTSNAVAQALGGESGTWDQLCE